MPDPVSNERYFLRIMIGVLVVVALMFWLILTPK